MDLALQGWPWLPGEASFVEPTSLALWALTSARLVTPQAVAAGQARIDLAVRYLADRRCRPAGWNVGNPMMFSRTFPPRACPTAWALLALQQIAPHVIRREDVDVLLADMRIDGGALALAWGLVALHALGQDDAGAQTRLTALREPDGGWRGNPYTTALANLATKERV